MKYLTLLIFTTILLIQGIEVKAQQDPIDGFFMMTPLKFNPAIVGTTDRTLISTTYRNQWSGITGAPVNYYLAASSPVYRTVVPEEDVYTIQYPTGLSVGLTMEQDKIGVSRFFKASVPIGVRVRVGRSGSRLSLGIKPNLNVGNSDITDLEQDAGELFNVDWKESYVNFDFGLYFYNTMWYLSSSITNVRDATTLHDFGYKREHHYFFSGGYVFRLNQNGNLHLRTTGLCALVSNSPASVTVSPSLIINNRFYAGVAYRFRDMAGLNTSYNLSNNLRFGYAFEYPTGRKSNKIGSTHEFMVQYVFEKKEEWVTSPRYFW